METGLYNMSIQCPYCWEVIEVTIDDCGEAQQYIEDCQVCCQPINFNVQIDNQGQLACEVYRDDE